MSLCEAYSPALLRSSSISTTDPLSRIKDDQPLSQSESRQYGNLEIVYATDIRLLDSKISRLHSILMSTERQRQQLRNKERTCSSLLAPIRRLPTELIEEILVLACEDATVYCGSGDPAHVSAVRLQSVCSRWQRVLQNTSRAWNSITVTTQSASFLQASRHDITTKALLSRSGSVPLTLALQTFTGSGDSVRWRITFMKLQSHFPRLVQLDVENAFQVLCKDETEGTQVCMWNKCPELTTISLKRTTSDEREGVNLCHFPKLSTVSLNGIDLCRLSIPTNQITSLVLQEQPDWSAAVSLLPSFDNLSNLTIFTQAKNKSMGPRRTYQWPTIDLLQMRTLCITGNSQHNSFMGAILASMNLPKITHVSLREESDLQSKGLRLELIPLFTSYSETLTSISLRGCNDGFNALISALEKLPFLSELHLDECGDTEDLVARMDMFPSPGGPHEETCLVPSLKHLSIAESTDLGEDGLRFEPVINMVRSRWDPIHNISVGAEPSEVMSLRVVRISLLHRKFPDHMISLLRSMKINGLAICVKDSEGFVEV